jgi:hypothetical protein
MCGHAVTLALAAGLTFAGAACANEQDPITTGSIAPAMLFSELNVKGEFGLRDLVRTGFGFSPFAEEGLVTEVPPARHHEFLTPVPAYRGDFRRVADSP